MKMDSFYQVPKNIFAFDLSNNAILLFMLCIDFYKLAEKNKSKKNDNIVFFISNDVQRILKITKPTFLKLKKELIEKKIIKIIQEVNGKKTFFTIGEKTIEIMGNKNKNQSKNFTSKEILPVKKFNQTSKNFLPIPVNYFYQTSKNFLPYYNNIYNNIIYNNKLNNNILSDSNKKIKKPVKKTDRKHKYYNHIFLTDKEYQTLQQDFGNAEELVKFLDDAISLKGYKYKSHYLAIRKWVVDAVEKEKLKKIKKVNQNRNFYDPLANVKI